MARILAGGQLAPGWLARSVELTGSKLKEGWVKNPNERNEIKRIEANKRKMKKKMKMKKKRRRS